MKENRMELLTFLNELANVHRDLDENMCLYYNMHWNTLISKDWRENTLEEIKVPSYKDKPTEVKSAYNQFFVEGTNKESVECILRHGMYFLPGQNEGSIIFGKSYFVITHDVNFLKNVKVVSSDSENFFLKEKVSEVPVDETHKKKSKFWEWLLLIIAFSILIWRICF